MYGWDLPVVPGPPKADLQLRVLEEWLTNPFLDDDVTALSVRLGDPVAALEEALTTLCDTGFLKAKGTGFMLALDLGGTMPALDEPAGAQHHAGPDPHEKAAVQLASLSGALAIDPETETDDDDGEIFLDLLAVDSRGDAVTREIEPARAELSSTTDGVDQFHLIEKLPFGMMVLLPTGAREMANRRAADMLGVAPEQLDGATFEMLTGVNPLAALETSTPLSFSLTAPRPLEVTLQGHRLPSGSVILILLRDVSLLEEVSKIQAEVQEELFQRLKTEMVDPLAMVERFLESPDADKLVQARIAMEQINWFLQEFFLAR
jgi:PAS domain-containing protein